jgi:hypothetical protein
MQYAFSELKAVMATCIFQDIVKFGSAGRFVYRDTETHKQQQGSISTIAV